MEDTYLLKILRGEPGWRFWESFRLPFRETANLVSALLEIQKCPVNAEGKKTSPVAFETGCLEEVCGSCSMLVNGRPRQACAALIRSLLQEANANEIRIAPLTKFPLVKDLIVDRSSMFENLKKIHAWATPSSQEGLGPPISQEKQELLYSLSSCMTCGCCVEGCPEMHERSSFMGPAIISQVRLFLEHPAAAEESSFRKEVMLQKGGIAGCGKSLNCESLCPKKIPLVDSIAAVNGAVTKYFWLRSSSV